MKKLFALLQVAVMCFSLVACGGDNTEETGDINNQTTNETTNNEEENVNFVGTWKGSCNSMEDHVTMVINEDGTGTMTEGKEESQHSREFNWEVKDGMFITNFLEGGFLEFAVNIVDGVAELNYENGIYIITLK